MVGRISGENKQTLRMFFTIFLLGAAEKSDILGSLTTTIYMTISYLDVSELKKKVHNLARAFFHYVAMYSKRLWQLDF